MYVTHKSYKIIYFKHLLSYHINIWNINTVTKPLHISLKNIENKSIFLTNDTPIKTHLSKENTNENIIAKEENNYAIPMSNILPDSYYNKNKKENEKESIDLTNDLKKMDIDDTVEEKARNTIIVNNNININNINNDDRYEI